MSFQRYINFVFDSEDIVELRLIAKGKTTVRLWRQAKELSKLEPYLQQQNAAGYNIYIGVNPRKEFNLSGDDNVLLARFLFADFDGVEAGDGCGIWEFVSDKIYQADIEMPDMTVFSGHGIHCYWQLKEPLKDLNRWRKLQKGLSEKLDSDKAIKNPERLMRLAGFKNVKNKPIDCFIL